MRLRPYQAEAAKELLDKKRILIADEMGLGKTPEAIIGKTAIELGRYKGEREIRVLVACPFSVVEHWKSEIEKWGMYGRGTRTVHVTTQDLDNRIRDAKGADFVILDHPTLSRIAHNPETLRRISALRFEYGVIDEGHNVKNPEALRTIATTELFNERALEYLTILTGTPMPNTVDDIYALMHLLDPKKFPIDPNNPKRFARSFFTAFKRDPEIVKRLLGERMLRRTVRDYLHEKVPVLEQNIVEVELNGDHRRVYEAIFEKAFSRAYESGTKLIQLQKAALDPQLVETSYLPESLARRQHLMESCVYTTMDGLLREIIRKKGKALIFTKFKEWVTEQLAQRWAKYNAVIADSDDVTRKIEGYKEREVPKREFLRRKFQQDPETKIMIATTVFNEGVDLTAATDIFHLGLPYTPAEYDQRNSRSKRFGEVPKEVVRSHIVKTILLKGMPTIDQGLEEMIEDKRRMITYLLEQPFKLSTADWYELKQRQVTRSKHISSLLGNLT